MAWVVTKDHLEPELSEYNRKGTGQWQGKTAPELKDLPHRAKLYDDDGELYYTVAFDDWADEHDEEYGGLYEAWRWGMYDAGATDLRVNGESIYA